MVAFHSPQGDCELCLCTGSQLRPVGYRALQSFVGELIIELPINRRPEVPPSLADSGTYVSRCSQFILGLGNGLMPDMTSEQEDMRTPGCTLDEAQCSEPKG